MRGLELTRGPLLARDREHGAWSWRSLVGESTLRAGPRVGWIPRLTLPCKPSAWRSVRTARAAHPRRGASREVYLRQGLPQLKRWISLRPRASLQTFRTPCSLLDVLCPT